MEQRLANTWHMTVNEKKFIETALASDLRIDGRRPFDYRRLSIKFGRNDGTAEVQLGQTHVMAFVTAQLVQPYRDRPNEGTLSVFTEFSPMADPSFEPGRPGEASVELARVIDRGLRESRAVDTESLCVLAGRSVWAIRVDLHILDNGGNLVDAVNIAALSALSTFRRPECTLGGEDDQEVIIHPPEVREPIPLRVHHLPIAVTFGFFGDGELVVIDPTYKEEAVMGGRMTVTINANGDVCAIQKAGGQGVLQSEIMQCMRIASVKSVDITNKIKNAVEAYNVERAKRKIKRHSDLDVHVNVDVKMTEVNDVSIKMESGILSGHQEVVKEEHKSQSTTVIDGHVAIESGSVEQVKLKKVNLFTGGTSSWDPYSEGINSSRLLSSSALHDSFLHSKREKDLVGIDGPDGSQFEEKIVDVDMKDSHKHEETAVQLPVAQKLSLADAVKVKQKKKKLSSANAGS
ncbi:exosome complex component RRP45A-like isoform X2 [Nymphaea colorata]|uniref:exosome complex component RRP45A-like isoform X2 n=1 Tax=Nymphaea colorata TaxID=210225 RepID=UPI00129D76CC|nr:exosome complex component RRP45A-like isoform X2 [Nymphaea colorata]